MLNKRCNKWYCQGAVNGKRYYQPCYDCKTKAEATKFEEELRHKLRTGEAIKENKIKFSFLMQKYVEVCEANNKTSRIAKIQQKYLNEYFGEDRDISTITASDIEAMKSYIRNKGRSEATVNRYFSAIKRAYNILKQEGVINYNPTNKCKKLRENNKRSRYLTIEEWQRLKQELQEPLYGIVLVAIHTGLRLSNCLNLHWNQIDLVLKTITISGTEMKGKKQITIPLSEVLYNYLKAKKIKSGYVFINPDTNKPFTSIKKSFASALKRAGIEDFHFHDLRRTVGTWLMQNNVDLRTIQQVLGHSNISTTERYLSLVPEQQRMAINILDNY